MKRRDHIHRAVMALEGLPRVPVGLARVAGAGDAVGARRLIDALERDAGMAADFRRVVDSGYFGVGDDSASVSEAIERIGQVQGRNLGLALIVRTCTIGHHRLPVDFSRVEFWRHCVGTAIAAEILAESRRVTHADHAFVAGLLHDIGIMAIDRVDPTAFTTVVERVQSGEAIAAADRTVLGVSHAEVGRWLCRAWKVEPVIADAVRHHHDPLSSPAHLRQLACIVYCADLAMAPPHRVYYGTAERHPEEAVLGRMGIDVPSLLAIRELALLRLGHASELLASGLAADEIRRAA